MTICKLKANSWKLIKSLIESLMCKLKIVLTSKLAPNLILGLILITKSKPQKESKEIQMKLA